MKNSVSREKCDGRTWYISALLSRNKSTLIIKYLQSAMGSFINDVKQVWGGGHNGQFCKKTHNIIFYYQKYIYIDGSRAACCIGLNYS